MDRYEQSRRDMNFDRTVKRTGIGFALWFAFCAVMAVAVIGVGVWAVISLVNWATSK